MTRMVVQCKGSGLPAQTGGFAKKGRCPWCHKSIEIAPSNGRLRKHMRTSTKAQLRRGY